MAKIYGAQRKLGYHDIVYNLKSGKFFVPLPGDNYYELDVQGTGGGTQTTATLPLANPTRLGRADSTGLKTQSDFNNYIDTYVKEVEEEAGKHFSGDYNDLSNKPSIPTDNAELTNGAGYITASDVPEVDLDGYATEDWVENKNYITIDQVPDPVLEGALIFKGNVANEGALPGDASVGDIYFNEEDSHMYAYGEDGQWHKLNTIDDVDLSGYARLDDDTQNIRTRDCSASHEIGVYPEWPSTSGTYTSILENEIQIKKNNNTVTTITDTYLRIGTVGVGNEVIKLDGTTGAVTATEFIGDGSKLTGVGLPDFRTLTPLS